MITLKLGEPLTQFNTYVLTITYEDGTEIFDFHMGEDLSEPFKLKRSIEALLFWQTKWTVKEFTDLDFSHIFNSETCSHPEMELEELHDTFYRVAWDDYFDRTQMATIEDVDLTYWDVSGILHQIEIERNDK